MSASRHGAAFTRPQSVQEIMKMAEDFDFYTTRSIQAWLRSGSMLLKQADMCEQDGNLQLAYLYLYRHAQLILTRLPEHPDFVNLAYRDDITNAQKAVSKNLAKLEQWKPRITQEHQRYARALEKQNAERRRVQRGREAAESRRSAQEGLLRRDSTGFQDGVGDNQSQMLNANEHTQLAVDLAQREIRRRDASRQSTREAGISPGTVAVRRRGVVMAPFDEEMAPDGDGPDDSVSAGVQQVGRQVQDSRDRDRDHRRDPGLRSSSRVYSYPTVPPREDGIEWSKGDAQTRLRPASRIQPPQPPPKELDQWQDDSPAPELPPRVRGPSARSPPRATQSPPPLISLIPSKYTFKPSAFTEAGSPLRTLFLPPDLRRTFLNIAHANTLRNLETCGILCGTLVSNALFINHLIIPDQESTSDTCDTTEDGDNRLFDYCDTADLLVCGWIHTHPSQSCFLSSRDLHTSSGYQVMLPEAIAIVCAPRQNPDWGIFRLTDPPGLGAVLNCRQTGLFHLHDENRLYTDALRPGHVVEGPGLKFEVVDLRNP